MAGKFTRRRLIGGAALALGAGAVGFPFVLRRSRKPRENVILIIADAMRAEKIGKIVGGAEVTPFLNRMAAEGLHFANAYVAASWTKPSVASILTGQHAMYHGVTMGAYTLPHIPTIQGYFADKGYFTFAVQTNNFLYPELKRARDKAETGFSRGFSLYVTRNRRRTDEDAKRGQKLRFYAPAAQINETFFKVLDRDGLLFQEAHYPFFAYLHYMDTHQPWVPAAPVDGITGKFYEGHMGEKKPAADAFEEYSREGVSNVLLNADGRSRNLDPSPRDRSLIEAINDEAAAYVDLCVGQLTEELRRRGILDNTTIIFTADHGDELWEHGRLCHGKKGPGKQLYEEVVRVPLVIRRTGVPAAKVSARVSNASIFATVREWFGDEDLPHTTLFSLMTGAAKPSEPTRETIYTMFDPSERKAILPDGRDVISVLESGPDAYYNIATDPGEEKPLAADREVIEALWKIEAITKEFAKLDNVKPLVTTHEWQLGGFVNGNNLTPEQREELRALGYIN